MNDYESLDLTALRNAIRFLQEAVDIAGDYDFMTQQTPPVQRTLTAGLIQNFEFTYEIAVKLLRRRLERDADSPEEIDAGNFRELLRAAGEKGLLADVAAWFAHRKMRNITPHTYQQEKAGQVCRHIPAFLADAYRLLQQLEARNA